MAELYVGLQDDESEAIARLGVALADPVRQAVLMRLALGSAYPGELMDVVGTTAPNLSNHLACLRGCGLVTAQREGRRMRYDLASAALGEALDAIVAVVCDCVADDEMSA
ncbi:MAG: winged helix-turn-helix transcriptional regulator [Acidimicrobiia bacterium]|nr:winged helix-turn-helix transcriptional regulator [Acidimicrobiia bacterium]